MLERIRDGIRNIYDVTLLVEIDRINNLKRSEEIEDEIEN